MGAIRGNTQSETNADPLASTWHPPPYSFVKVNCDAAWLPSSKQAGLRFVARNSEGEIIFSGAKHVKYLESVLLAKADITPRVLGYGIFSLGRLFGISDSRMGVVLGKVFGTSGSGIEMGMTGGGI
ncbi:hypothetical protein Tco_1196312 [Tanacetum coccineum]